MVLETLELRNFRNYEAEEVVFHEKINILTGRNAQGKTSLVEAVGLLALGKSFRTRREQEMVRFGEAEARVRGVFEKKGRPHTTEVRLGTGLGKGLVPGGSPGLKGKKPYVVNGLETGTVADLLGGVYTIVFSPEDLRVVKGDPETRRRFLDRELILQRPLYYHKLKKYRHALKNRNALLKGEQVDAAVLDVYDDQFAEAACEVMKERAAWVLGLSEAASAASALITDGVEEISAEYKPSLAGTMGEKTNCLSKIDDKALKSAICDVLTRGRERDIQLRSTEAGPHRDDFAVFAGGLDLRVYGSQGQQRTAALSLRLAERELIKKETGEDAILLLDDVMSELDRGRQDRLLESFGDNQIFITSAEHGLFGSGGRLAALRGAKVMKVEGGRIV
ncbi:MAG: DNA replication/repair protein RecF [Clostridiales bacterium]|nr:DNA replication/repair protein RecF [Clostridiales bacterium]